MDTSRRMNAPGVIIQTAYGTFKVEKYELTRTNASTAVMVGATLQVTFTPDGAKDSVNQPIGLIQAVRIFRETDTAKGQYEDDTSKVARMTERGTHIDQSTYVDPKGNVLSEQEAKEQYQKSKQIPIPQTNPVYHATNMLDKYATTLIQQAGPNGYGCMYSPTGKPFAQLSDSPHRVITEIHETILHEFEIVALTLTSPYRCLGSMTWGYKAISGDTPTNIKHYLLDVAPGKDDRPTDEFRKAAELWNKQKVYDFSQAEKIARVQIPDL